MAFRKKTGGRKVGSRNKVPVELKAMITEALDRLGGVNYLVAQGSDVPASFLTLLGKIIPSEVKMDSKSTVEHKISPEMQKAAQEELKRIAQKL